jgi:hypothetical protein
MMCHAGLTNSMYFMQRDLFGQLLPFSSRGHGELFIRGVIMPESFRYLRSFSVRAITTIKLVDAGLIAITFWPQ